MNKRKILVIAQDCIGGAERVSVTFAKQLLAENFDVSFGLVRLKDSTAESLRTIIPENIGCETIVWDSQIGLMRNLHSIIKRIKPDIVFASAMHLNQRLLVLKALFFNGIKAVVRNDNYLYTLPRHKRLSLKMTYQLADFIVSQTAEMEKELIDIGLSPDKILTVRNPIDKDDIDRKLEAKSPFLGKDEQFRYLAIGRISHQKGFDILIRAFRKVKTAIPQSKLFILGDTNYEGGQYYRYLCSIVKECELEDEIVFCGFSDNPYRYLRDCDVYVLSSRYEGLPNTLLEAQYIGCTPVATKCIPIIERMICDGQDGFLAEPENADSLARAMIRAHDENLTLTRSDNNRSSEIVELLSRL